jgi:hypothetical protein
MSRGSRLCSSCSTSCDGKASRSRPLEDKDKTGRRFPLGEIDPFTVFSTFNRGITNENRVRMAARLRTKFAITAGHITLRGSRFSTIKVVVLLPTPISGNQRTYRRSGRTERHDRQRSPSRARNQIGHSFFCPRGDDFSALTLSCSIASSKPRSCRCSLSINTFSREGA